MTTITTTTNEQNIVEQQSSTQQTTDSNKYVSKEFAIWEDLEDLNPDLLRGIYASCSVRRSPDNASASPWSDKMTTIA